MCVFLMQIYDGSNMESLSMFDPKYLEEISNRTIVSSDSVVLVKLAAVRKSIFGIKFLISWMQIDKFSPNILDPDYIVLSEYFFNFIYYLINKKGSL